MCTWTSINITCIRTFSVLLNANSLNAELDPICLLLELLRAHHIFHVSELRDKLGGTRSNYNGYRVFPGGKKQPGRDPDPSLPSSAVVKKEYRLYGLYGASVSVQGYSTIYLLLTQSNCWALKGLKFITCKSVSSEEKSRRIYLKHLNAHINLNYTRTQSIRLYLKGKQLVRIRNTNRLQILRKALGFTVPYETRKNSKWKNARLRHIIAARLQWKVTSHKRNLTDLRRLKNFKIFYSLLMKLHGSSNHKMKIFPPKYNTRILFKINIKRLSFINVPFFALNYVLTVTVGEEFGNCKVQVGLSLSDIK